MAIWLKVVITILIGIVGILVTAAILGEGGPVPAFVGGLAGLIFWNSI